MKWNPQCIDVMHKLRVGAVRKVERKLIVHTEEYCLTFQSVRILKALSATIHPGRLARAYVDNSAVFASTGVSLTEC